MCIICDHTLSSGICLRASYTTTTEQKISALSESDSEFQVSSDESSGESDSPAAFHQPGPSGQRPTKLKRPSFDKNNTYNWKNEVTYKPKLHDFIDNDSGINPTLGLTDDSLELDYFLLFFDEVLIEFIVNQTNLYYRYLVEKEIITSRSITQKWKDTTVREIFTFLGVFCLMAHVKKSNKGLLVN